MTAIGNRSKIRLAIRAIYENLDAVLSVADKCNLLIAIIDDQRPFRKRHPVGGRSACVRRACPKIDDDASHTVAGHSYEGILADDGKHS